MNKRKFSVEIETIRSGQPRKYADSEYEYILTVEGMREYEVKAYCTMVLCYCRQTKEEWCKGKGDSAAVYFAGYYTFEKIEENKYRYYMMQPYCD